MASPSLDKLKATRTVKFTSDLLCVARVPESEKLWIGSNDFKVYFLDLSAEKPVPTALEGHSSFVSGVVLAGKTLISAGWDRKLIWWDTELRKQVRSVDAHQRWIRQLALSPDSKLAASVSDDMVCKLWDTSTGKLVRELKGHATKLPRYHYPNKLYACAFSPDSKFIAASDELCQVIVWEVATGKEAVRFDAPAFLHHDWDRNNHPYGGLRCLTFSPDGQVLGLGGMQNADVAIIQGTPLVQLFDWKAGKRTHELKAGKDFQYETLYFHPRGDWLLALPGGTQKNAPLHFYDLKENRLKQEINNALPIFGLAVSEKLDAFYTVGRNQVIKWEFMA